MDDQNRVLEMVVIFIWFQISWLKPCVLLRNKIRPDQVDWFALIGLSHYWEIRFFVDRLSSALRRQSVHMTYPIDLCRLDAFSILCRLGQD